MNTFSTGLPCLVISSTGYISSSVFPQSYPGSRRLRCCTTNVENMMQPEQMETDNSQAPVSLSKRMAMQQEIRSFLNPNMTEHSLNTIFDVLNAECRTLRKCDLCSLSADDFCEFIYERFKVRSYYLSCVLQNINKGEIVNENQTVRLFSDFNITTETAIRHFLQSEYCQKTAGINIFFRAGKFTCINDEMGRSKNSILKKQIFDPKTINQMGKVHGIGLYSAPHIATAMSYINKSYNEGYPVTILAIYIKPGVNVISLLDDSAFSFFLNQKYPASASKIKDNIRNDMCHIENCLYLMPSGIRYGYTLIKSPELIKKAVPYDYTMLTKLHIPFTADEIGSYKMEPKPMLTKVQSEYVSHHSVEIKPDSPTSLLPIYRYITTHTENALDNAIFNYHITLHDSENIRRKHYKFFTMINGKNYKVRPSARNHELSRDFSSPTFKIQYRPAK